MKLTKNDTQMFETFARSCFINDSAEKQFEDGTIATDKDFGAVCMLKAAYAVFVRGGLISSEAPMPTFLKEANVS